MLLRVSRDGEVEGDYWVNLFEAEQCMTRERLNRKHDEETRMYEIYRGWQQKGYPVHKEKVQVQKRRRENG